MPLSQKRRPWSPSGIYAESALALWRIVELEPFRCVCGLARHSTCRGRRSPPAALERSNLRLQAIHRGLAILNILWRVQRVAFDGLGPGQQFLQLAQFL